MWWQGLLDEPSKDPRGPASHCTSEDPSPPEQGLSILPTKGAIILELLAPGMEDRIGRKGVERGIQGSLFPLFLSLPLSLSPSPLSPSLFLSLRPLSATGN